MRKDGLRTGQNETGLNIWSAEGSESAGLIKVLSCYLPLDSVSYHQWVALLFHFSSGEPQPSPAQVLGDLNMVWVTM